jgi:hypothetical protein
LALIPMANGLPAASVTAQTDASVAGLGYLGCGLQPRTDSAAEGERLHRLHPFLAVEHFDFWMLVCAGSLPASASIGLSRDNPRFNVFARHDGEGGYSGGQKKKGALGSPEKGDVLRNGRRNYFFERKYMRMDCTE